LTPTTGQPWLVVALLTLLALWTAGCGVNEPGAVSAAPEVPEAFASAFTPISNDEPTIEDFFVSVHDVVGAMDAGMDVVFIDARPELDFEFGHIEGAINIPYFEVEEHLDKVPADRWMVTYCECPHHEAGQAAQALYDAGFPYVKVLEEGLGGWRDELGRPLVMPPADG
jgi:cytochrome c oxidase cbb3-type subunit 3/ubiquinol-cytochrome c reductase cytochrome c subunit